MTHATSSMTIRMEFDTGLRTPNTVTLAAIEEGERMLHDPNAPRFSSVEDLFADLNTK